MVIGADGADADPLFGAALPCPSPKAADVRDETKDDLSNQSAGSCKQIADSCKKIANFPQQKFHCAKQIVPSVQKFADPRQKFGGNRGQIADRNDATAGRRDVKWCGDGATTSPHAVAKSLDTAPRHESENGTGGSSEREDFPIARLVSTDGPGNA